ncbi:hypothetical protein P9112_009072 [Eukaryota sp. TZLM1-RC]
MFGLLLLDIQFLTVMGVKLNLTPPQCLSDTKCKCGAYAPFEHIVFCFKFTQKRSTLHNAVRDCIYDLLKCAHQPVRLESLFDELICSLSKKRGDIQCECYDGTELITDCTTVSP